ncbi:MAG: BolA/IbaG family iron-sulfur metabolism protein [Xanthomonadales bacterium]|nr:BolA/IbaG family iron-sulfur metabolism protein [Xanthomonadales bacterium]
MDCDTIKQLIQATLSDANIHVSGDDGVHFEATVVSRQFEGLNRLKRHRLVYGALGDRMGGEIHALSLTTLTPEEQGG